MELLEELEEIKAKLAEHIVRLKEMGEDDNFELSELEEVKIIGLALFAREKEIIDELYEN